MSISRRSFLKGMGVVAASAVVGIGSSSRLDVAAIKRARDKYKALHASSLVSQMILSSKHLGLSNTASRSLMSSSHLRLPVKLKDVS